MGWMSKWLRGVGFGVVALAALCVGAAEQGEDGQWPMPGKNYQGTRYSGLDQITTENVKTLQAVFEMSLGVNRGQEAAPIVVGKTMYVVTGYPNILYAIDLEKMASKQNALKWVYKAKPMAAAQGVAC